MKLIGLILLSICFPVMAENEYRFQDWDVVGLDDKPMAMTFNKTGSALALACDPSIDTCNLLIMSTHVLCGKSQKIPVLVGIDNAVLLICARI